MKPELSIVIPLYNEQERIPKTIGIIFDFLKTYDSTTEVIFVNDGSKDDTSRVLEEYKKVYDFRIVSYSENRGKGYAVRQGVFAADGSWIAFFDIDLATPLTALDELLRHMKTGKEEILIGSRRIEGSAILKTESGLRTFLGQGYTLLSRIFVPEVRDFTCGFKAYRRDVAKKIFAAAKIDRWAFDTEVLYLGKRFGYSIRQIPVQWTHDTASRVRVWRDVAHSLKELALIVWFSVSGSYRREMHE
ncbi:MAG: hypothetical protein RIQ56_584 [Candidatus Parcubacteria bacterium]